MSWLLAMLLKPFVAAAYLLALLGIKTLVLRLIPEGKLKRILLLPIGSKRRNG
jgi:hypothetical protein